MGAPVVSGHAFLMVTMVTMGGDLEPGCLADRLLTGCRPATNISISSERKRVAMLLSNFLLLLLLHSACTEPPVWPLSSALPHHHFCLGLKAYA